jgi:hypothetical protein
MSLGILKVRVLCTIVCCQMEDIIEILHLLEDIASKTEVKK